jgi:hypothetical protein
MKPLIFAILALTALPSLSAQVNGYMRRDGTYVAPHMRSNPNSSKLDNYSSQGNVNPYTGRQGTVNPYQAPQMAPQPNPYPNPYGNPYSSPYRP